MQAVMERPTLRLVELRRTSAADPSEWRGRTEGGRRVYVRYRDGILAWGFGRTDEEAERASQLAAPMFVPGKRERAMPEEKMLELLDFAVRP